MSPQETAKTVVVVNPSAAAGGGTTPPVAERLARFGSVLVEETARPGHARDIAAAAAEAGAERVIAVGGDGTVHEVVNGLATRPRACRLGIVAGGTGNDTARSLGIPVETEDAIALLEDGEARPIDLVEVRIDGGREVAVNAITGGFGGEVAEGATEELKDRWGPLAYLRSAADTLSEIPCFRIRLSVDGAPSEELRVYSIVVANGPYAAHGVGVAPGALPDDGLLAVHVVLESSITEVLAMVPTLLAGKVPSSDRYRTWACREVSLASEAPMEGSVDGELRRGRRFRYRILPAALDVYRP